MLCCELETERLTKNTEQEKQQNEEKKMPSVLQRRVGRNWMEKNCRELTKVYVYRKRSGREGMHLNPFSGGQDVL